MIIFSGYGIIFVLLYYFGGLFLVSKLSPYFFKTEKQQYIVLLLFHIAITFINFLLSKYLNRKELKHTVYELRLEFIMMCKGVLY